MLAEQDGELQRDHQLKESHFQAVDQVGWDNQEETVKIDISMDNKTFFIPFFQQSV